MSYEGLLTQSANITRPARATGSVRGNVTFTTVSGLSAVPCLLKAASASEILTDHERTRAQYKLFLPYGTDVKSQDRIVIDSVNYESISPYLDPGGRHHHIEVMVYAVQ